VERACAFSTKKEMKMNRKERRAAKARRNARNSRKTGSTTAQKVRTGRATTKTPLVNQVSAFWANDRPGGLGFAIPFEDPKVGLKVCRVLHSALATYDAHPEVAPNFYLAQLCDFGSRAGGLTDEEMMIAITNIYWLQERGYLAADEYNGVIFAWTVEEGRRRTLMMGEQNPLVIDHVGATRNGIDVTEAVKATAKAGAFASDAAFTAVLDYARALGRNGTEGDS
jgi:hypothetical protein